VTAANSRGLEQPIGTVPAHHVAVFAARRTSYCLCVFVLNEGDRVLRQLDRMAAAASLVDIIVADGGSTDGSVAADKLKPRGVKALLTLDGRPGLGTQMRMAFSFALSEGYDGVIVIDGNDKDDPAAVSRFVGALDEGYDHVQGSRFIPGGRHRNTPASRLWGLRLLHAPTIRWASGFPYTDTTNGFRAYSRALLVDPRVDVFRDVFSGYELHYYLAIRAARLGFRVCEIPVTREYPNRGSIPTKISPISGTLRILRALACACTGQFDPDGGKCDQAREGHR
jgi:dolichol-phosphate mannosyltransferase